MYIFLFGISPLGVGSGNASAQATASATIQGTVTDKSGAVVSGAQVVAKNKATDLTREATTSETGYYRFELLPVGTYADRKSTRLNSSHSQISYAVFCLKKKKNLPV